VAVVQIVQILVMKLLFNDHNHIETFKQVIDRKVFSRILDDGKVKKKKKREFCVIHHHQNPLESRKILGLREIIILTFFRL
jgi:hypothetical protein